MSFAEQFSPKAVYDAVARAERASVDDVRAAVTAGVPDTAAAATLLSGAAMGIIEELGQAAHRLTIDRFGKTVALFAPLYLSNDCVCTCTYCGFSMGLDIKRKTLRIDEVAREARSLAGHGFRNILLVSSEHPKYVQTGYLAQCVGEVKRLAQYVALEVAAAEQP
ncbi:MAG TPA: hypothetical protein VGW96_02280, partial [Candidatus Eremiobacteraceae bacterium]|nr:hypothetical protein [Candidatus Eremiobacteraceae bacterium]